MILILFPSVVESQILNLEDLPLQKAQNLGIDTILFFIVALIVFLLAIFSGACMKNTLNTDNKAMTLPEKLWRFRILGQAIAVYVLVCLPITWISFVAYSSGEGFGVVIAAFVPIFTAGLALEEHAERLIAHAQDDARKSSPPGKGTDKSG